MLELATPLGVNIIWQENDTFCGPACAKMILEYIKPELAPEAVIDFQTELYCDICHDTLNTMLWTTPTGLETTIQKRLRDDSEAKSSYLLNCRTTEPMLSRAICWSLLAHRTPVAVLVSGSDHWVIAVDCTVSDVPTSIDDLQYTIGSFETHDPYFMSAESSTTSRVSRITTYESWVDSSLKTPVKVKMPDASLCHGFVAIIDGREIPMPEYETNFRESSMTTSFEVEGANAEIAAKAFYDSKPFPAHAPWSSLPDDLEPLAALPVELPLSADELVYLVPFVKPEDTSPTTIHVPLVMIFAAKPGAIYVFRDAIAAQFTVVTSNSFFGNTFLADHVDMLNPGSVLQKFRTFGFRLDPESKPLFPPDEAIIQDNLWWRPCRESYSPFLPFYRFMLPSLERFVYVRLDGRVFYELHDSENNVLTSSTPQAAPLATGEGRIRFEFREMSRGARPIPR